MDFKKSDMKHDKKWQKKFQKKFQKKNGGLVRWFGSWEEIDTGRTVNPKLLFFDLKRKGCESTLLILPYKLFGDDIDHYFGSIFKQKCSNVWKMQYYQYEHTTYSL
jgi:hypothetical protein